MKMTGLIKVVVIAVGLLSVGGLLAGCSKSNEAAASSVPQTQAQTANTNSVENDASALIKMQEQAQRGDAKAQAALGLSYQIGEHVPQDDTKAVYWIQKAADQGLAEGQLSLGLIYYFGKSVPEDDTKALYWIQKAADQGFPLAQYFLGDAYYNGHGVPQDDTKAAYWYQKGADQGLAQAQFNLGDAYVNGKGVPQDDTKAVYWYQKAADQGFSSAQLNLGNAYVNGKGVPQDDTKAVYWIQKAADQGYAPAKKQIQEAMMKMRTYTMIVLCVPPAPYLAKEAIQMAMEYDSAMFAHAMYSGAFRDYCSEPMTTITYKDYMSNMIMVGRRGQLTYWYAQMPNGNTYTGIGLMSRDN